MSENSDAQDEHKEMPQESDAQDEHKEMPQESDAQDQQSEVSQGQCVDAPQRFPGYVDEFDCQLNKWQFAGHTKFPGYDPGPRVISGMYSDDVYAARAKEKREERLSAHKKCVHCKIEAIENKLAEITRETSTNTDEIRYMKQHACMVM